MGTRTLSVLFTAISQSLAPSPACRMNWWCIGHLYSFGWGSRGRTTMSRAPRVSCVDLLTWTCDLWPPQYSLLLYCARARVRVSCPCGHSVWVLAQMKQAAGEEAMLSRSLRLQRRVGLREREREESPEQSPRDHGQGGNGHRGSAGPESLPRSPALPSRPHLASHRI